MSWNYEQYLKQKLTVISYNYEDVKIEICNEQMFAKLDAPIPKTIYVVIKYLSTSIAYNSTIQPVQILVVSESNQMIIAKQIMDQFANENNWQMVIVDSTYVKQQYSSPVVLSNFNDVGYDFRSVLYVSGTLIVMEDVVDVQDLTITIGENDPETIEPISFQFQYNASGDTQPVGGNKIAQTIKSIATVSLAIVIPPLESTFLATCLDITNGTISGNTKFHVEFSIDNISFEYDTILTGFGLTTSPNNVPALTINLMN